jgi:phosphoserine phosphatase
MIRIDRRALLAAWAALPLMGCAVAGDGGPADPLPSWNGGPAKTAIVEFVEAVTTEGGVDYVPPDARIATFDNDGTLWAEQPIYFQFAFALDRIKALAPQHPEWQDTQPFKAVLEGDPKALAASGEEGLLEIIAATHAGMTTDEFSAIVADWLATARHPRFDRPYTELVYQPMLELLAYLRESGFKTFIVSGGGVEFMRVFAERVRYSARAGGRLVGRCEARDGAGRQARPQERGQVEFVDDGPGKPVGINRFIGRRPVMAFGNSDRDLQMLQWTTAGDGPRLGLIVHHTDAEREWAYDRDSHVGKLDQALDQADSDGWTVVDMKNDWKTIFPAAPR